MLRLEPMLQQSLAAGLGRAQLPARQAIPAGYPLAVEAAVLPGAGFLPLRHLRAGRLSAGSSPAMWPEARIREALEQMDRPKPASGWHLAALAVVPARPRRAGLAVLAARPVAAVLAAEVKS